MKTKSLSLYSALATVLYMAEEQLSHDIEENRSSKMMGFFDQVDTKAEARAIRRVAELYKLLAKENDHDGALT